jgi:hypothetical protein
MVRLVGMAVHTVFSGEGHQDCSTVEGGLVGQFELRRAILRPYSRAARCAPEAFRG